MGVAEALINRGTTSRGRRYGLAARGCERSFRPARIPCHRRVDRPGRLRQGTLASTAQEAPCPSCGVLSGRVHQRVRQRLADVPVASRVEVVLVERRFTCPESMCGRRTFVETSDQMPLRARVTTRLRVVLLEVVGSAAPVVAEVADGHGVSWWRVQRTAKWATASSAGAGGSTAASHWCLCPRLPCGHPKSVRGPAAHGVRLKGCPRRGRGA
jgi:hypothetical protein